VGRVIGACALSRVGIAIRIAGEVAVVDGRREGCGATARGAQESRRMAARKRGWRDRYRP